MTRTRGPLTAVSRSRAMVASSPVSSVNVWTRITPDGSTPRWRFRQPRRPRPPCVAAAHGPSQAHGRTVSSPPWRCDADRDAVVAGLAGGPPGRRERPRPWRRPSRAAVRPVLDAGRTVAAVDRNRHRFGAHYVCRLRACRQLPGGGGVSHHAGYLRRAVVGYQVTQPDCGLTQRAMSCEKASTSSSCAPVGNTQSWCRKSSTHARSGRERP